MSTLMNKVLAWIAHGQASRADKQANMPFSAMEMEKRGPLRADGRMSGVQTGKLGKIYVPLKSIR
jgi:hypothetical protein